MLSSSTNFFLQLLFVFLSFNFITKAQTPTPLPAEETEKVFTEEIKLNVIATDIDGKFVSGVKKEDLVINEDGRLHQANSIKRIPANVLIMMDTGGEMRQVKGFKQTVDTAKGLINTLQSEDSVAIMQYNDKVEIIAEWTNKEEALTLLRSKANFGKRSVFIDALENATKFLQKNPLENRHLVLITDGTDTFNKLSERDAAMKNLLATNINVHIISYTQLERADIEPRTKGISNTPPKALPDEVAAQMPNGVRDLNRATRILTINTDRAFLRKMRERKQDLIDSEKYLAALAKDTNGEFILPETKQEMLDKTALVAQIIDSSYVITYTPKRPLVDSQTGEVRNIDVTSRRPNLLVQAHRKLVVIK
ncbi:MAG: VWA domain-containing protein [Acidobacteria bacterium]|nr:VWA domain-containing protein [Acidobacteriota bacterium]